MNFNLAAGSTSIITFSFGWTEPTFSGTRAVQQRRYFPVRNVTRTLADFRLTAATCATSLLNGESSTNSKPRKSQKPNASRRGLENRRRAADRLCTGGKCWEFSESMTKGKFALARRMLENVFLSLHLIASNSWRSFVFSFWFSLSFFVVFRISFIFLPPNRR